jgi:dihydroxyacid dehydratase/phosphogluconate dehydratase
MYWSGTAKSFMSVGNQGNIVSNTINCAYEAFGLTLPCAAVAVPIDLRPI